MIIDIEMCKNRLLTFCYVPATSSAHNRLLFFSFLLQPFTVLMKQTRQAVRAIKKSIFLDVYDHDRKRTVYWTMLAYSNNYDFFKLELFLNLQRDG